MKANAEQTTASIDLEGRNAKAVHVMVFAGWSTVRTAQRNGYKERFLKIRVGELILKKPQFRGHSFKILCFR